jgi:hypothetical protein
MYEPYPSGEQMPEQPQPAAAPPPVLMAVKLMYAGAALSAIGLILQLATISSLKAAIVKRYPNDTPSQVHSIQTAGIVAAVIGGLIGIGIWIWMARANNAGKSWARVTGTVFFGIDTLLILGSFVRPQASLGLVFTLIVWLTGLGTVILLWRRESSQYFAAMSGSRTQPG